MKLKHQYPNCGVPTHQGGGCRSKYFYRDGGHVRGPIVPICGFCRTMDPGKFCRQNGVAQYPRFRHFTQDTIDEHTVQSVMES